MLPPPRWAEPGKTSRASRTSMLPPPRWAEPGKTSRASRPSTLPRPRWAGPGKTSRASRTSILPRPRWAGPGKTSRASRTSMLPPPWWAEPWKSSPCVTHVNPSTAVGGRSPGRLPVRNARQSFHRRRWAGPGKTSRASRTSMLPPTWWAEPGKDSRVSRPSIHPRPFETLALEGLTGPRRPKDPSPAVRHRGGRARSGSDHGFEVELALGEPGQRLVRQRFLVERFLEEVRCLVVAELLGERARHAVAGHLVVLHPL